MKDLGGYSKEEEFTGDIISLMPDPDGTGNQDSEDTGGQLPVEDPDEPA